MLACASVASGPASHLNHQQLHRLTGCRTCSRASTTPPPRQSSASSTGAAKGTALPAYQPAQWDVGILSAAPLTCCTCSSSGALPWSPHAPACCSLISGMHSSITAHICGDYLIDEATQTWGVCSLCICHASCLCNCGPGTRLRCVHICNAAALCAAPLRMVANGGTLQVNPPPKCALLTLPCPAHRPQP